MCTGRSLWPARSSRRATVSLPGSSRSRANSAWLSRTMPGKLGILQGALFGLVLGPFLGERLVARLAFEYAAQFTDGCRRHGLEQDALVGGRDDGAGAVLDLKEFAEPAGNDHLAFGGEPHGIRLLGRLHDL